MNLISLHLLGLIKEINRAIYHDIEEDLEVWEKWDKPKFNAWYKPKFSAWLEINQNWLEINQNLMLGFFIYYSVSFGKLFSFLNL